MPTKTKQCSLCHAPYGHQAWCPTVTGGAGKLMPSAKPKLVNKPKPRKRLRLPPKGELELLPCPCCGSKPIWRRGVNWFGKWEVVPRIRCRNRTCRLTMEEKISSQKLAERWNNRVHV